VNRENPKYELRGINHLALVCRDMERTVHFYQDVLGMPLIKTIDLPGGMGQHFFFDIGGGDSLAFFWFPEAPEPVHGVSSPDPNVFFDPKAELVTAIASMNHVAFDVEANRMEEYRERLVAEGIKVTPIINHDNSPRQVSMEWNDETFVRSMYFFDPDGILLEFAAWTTVFDESDIAHTPARWADRDRYLAEQAAAKEARAAHLRERELAGAPAD
jgi:catechol 2,3-dioxygenase-like lactoylglutathione lyase family enzyme